MRFHFVVNPAAGRRQALPLVEAIIRALEEGGAETSCYVTTAAGDGANHVGDLAADACDRLIVVGGDGTLHEVVNARDLPLPWPVGIVPMGTANIVGREVRMPLDRRAARVAASLLASEPWTVDVMQLTHADGRVERAVANMGVGLDAEIVRAVSRVRSGGSGGYAKWIRPVLDSLSSFRFPHLRVTIDDRITYAAAAVIVQNAQNYGGVFRLSPQARLDSGCLDVMIIRARTHRALFGIVLSGLMRRGPRNKDVKFVRGTRVSLQSEKRAAVQADGDPAGWTDVDIECVPGGLTLLRAP